MAKLSNNVNPSYAPNFQRINGRLALVMRPTGARELALPVTKTLLDDKYGKIEIQPRNQDWELIITVKDENHDPIWVFGLPSSYSSGIISRSIQVQGIGTPRRQRIRIGPHEFHQTSNINKAYKYADYLMSYLGTCHKELGAIAHIGLRQENLHIHKAAQYWWNNGRSLDLNPERLAINHCDFFYFPIFQPHRYIELLRTRNQEASAAELEGLKQKQRDEEASLPRQSRLAKRVDWRPGKPPVLCHCGRRQPYGDLYNGP